MISKYKAATVSLPQPLCLIQHFPAEDEGMF
jgi:hypothetical protein